MGFAASVSKSSMRTCWHDAGLKPEAMCIQAKLSLQHGQTAAVFTLCCRRPSPAGFRGPIDAPDGADALRN